MATCIFSLLSFSLYKKVQAKSILASWGCGMDPITKILTTVCACGFLHLINFFPSTNQLQGLERKIQLGEEKHVGHCK
jgi:hypothetical protein